MMLFPLFQLHNFLVMTSTDGILDVLFLIKSLEMAFGGVWLNSIVIVYVSFLLHYVMTLINNMLDIILNIRGSCY